MASDVFVSYSSADRVLAEAIVHELETHGIDCWIAPRNILPGANYSEAIVTAIHDAEVMVVVVSEDANRSGHVPREVERAAAHNVSLVPLRIADIEPSPSLEYFLSCQHWLHALPPPVEAHLARLVDAVAALLALRRHPASAHRGRPATSPRSPARVPAPVALFTGRTAERAEIHRQLAAFPVVTLVGPPGAGKTELARMVATELDASTVAYLDLSALSVRSSLATTVATAIGLDPATTWEETLDALADIDAVLVLDNAETALAVDAEDFRRSLRELLERCRRCRILATSRERLGLSGAESVVRVGPLPPREAEDLLEALLRSHAARPSAEDPSAEDPSAIAQVHALADGLPLALVIAAAWLSEVPVTTFLREWQRSRSALLSLPGFESPDRAASLEVSVSLSFEALGADARRLLQALSLHPAGASTELLAEILPDDAALLPSTAELVRKSLVERTGSHLRLLTPIREIVRQRTADEAIQPLLLAALAGHTHRLHESLSHAYRIDSGSKWERLADILANVGALVDDGLRVPSTVGPAIELVAAACLGFRGTGRIAEGLDYLDKALDKARGSVREATLIEERGHLLRAGARLPAALSAYQDALALWSRQGHPDREAVCHLRIGDVLRLMGSYDTASKHYQASVRLHEELVTNPLTHGDAIECLADLACVTGDWDRAITHYTEAQRMFRSVPDGLVGMTNTAHSLGETRLALRDVAGARVDYEAALRTSQRIGDLQGQANALLGLAKTDLVGEDFPAAQRRARDAAEIYDKIDDGLGAANALVTMGDLALAQGQFTIADTAYADAEAAFRTLSCPLNRVLVSLRRLLARQLGWESPQVLRAREEFEALTQHSISPEESRRWPLEKKGSVFHGSLEMTGGGEVISSPIVAVVTPFDARGAVDTGALQNYLELLSAAGVRTILVNGTTGEFFAMTVRERGAVLEFCREHWPGTVIAQVGSAAIGDAMELLERARSHTDYLMAISPYYFAHPPEDGVCAYFRQLLGHSDLPLLLYHFPRHAQTEITPSVVSRLAAEFPLLVGVKDSGKDRGVTRAFKAVRPQLQVFLGDDRAGARLAEIGVDGLVTGGGSPVVELPLRIADAVQGDDPEHAEQLQAHFDRWSDARRASPLTEIAFVKAALGARLPGFPRYVRPPLVSATDSQCEQIRGFLRHTMLPLITP